MVDHMLKLSLCLADRVDVVSLSHPTSIRQGEGLGGSLRISTLILVILDGTVALESSQGSEPVNLMLWYPSGHLSSHIILGEEPLWDLNVSRP